MRDEIRFSLSNGIALANHHKKSHRPEMTERKNAGGQDIGSILVHYVKRQLGLLREASNQRLSPAILDVNNHANKRPMSACLH